MLRSSKVLIYCRSACVWPQASPGYRLIRCTGDLFDRMLVWQAICMVGTLVSRLKDNEQPAHWFACFEGQLR